MVTPYIFAVCTYGDSPCIALEYLSELLHSRGLRLMGGFGVKMPYNYIRPKEGGASLFKPFALKETTDEEQRLIFGEAKQKIDRIAKFVQAREEGSVEAEYRWIEHAVDALNLRETLQKKVWLKIGGFHAFFADDRCVRCGTCAKVCPVNNIQLTKDGPCWKHQCEQCFACLNWCPKSALQFGKGTAGQNRYHHPDVSLFDMLRDGLSD
jgi:ferredoxin